LRRGDIFLADVFVVDDEVFIQDLYLNLLALAGHRVVESAFNGQEAVDKFKGLAHPPDLIIMDHRMPVKNGVDATKEIRAIDPDVKVLFISADATAQTRAVEAGALEFLEKPFSMDVLYLSIDRCLAAAPLTR
jgi:two-component system, chemotaxis family, chemotaxis protein CheY